MKSKIVQKMQDEYNALPFWKRFKIRFEVEYYTFRMLGLYDYITKRRWFKRKRK